MAIKKLHPEDPSIWLEQARRGDSGAFEQIYRATCNAIYAVCLRLSADPALAEECVQRTYVKAWNKLQDFSGESRLQTWLHRIAVNEVLSLGRRNRQLLAATDEFQAFVQLDPSGELDLENAITQLPERQRQVFVLYAVYGHSHEEVASQLDIAPGTSKAHYHRARQLLQKLLGDADSGQNSKKTRKDEHNE